MKLQVTNVARSLSQHDFEKLFSKYNPTECILIMDPATKLHKGFGFVVIDDDAVATTAVQEVNARLVDGQKIKVKIAEEKK